MKKGKEGKEYKPSFKKKFIYEQRLEKNIEEIKLKYPSLNYSHFHPKKRNEESMIRCNLCGYEINCSVDKLLRSKVNNFCPICGESRLMNLQDWKLRASYIHNNFYNYENSIYEEKWKKIKIVCPEHGEFEQLLMNHLKGQGCPSCVPEKMKGYFIKDGEKFIEDCKKIHKGYYDYSLTEYDGALRKIKIICPKHGVFEQEARNHLKGMGCRYCSVSKGEKELEETLNKHNILFKQQKTFKGCFYSKKDRLRFDFYIPEKNICIEYQGKQHYEPVKHWRGEKGFKNLKIRDQIKRDFCKENNIRLIEIPYTEFDNIESILQKEGII